MTITIPVWALWTIAIVVRLPTLVAVAVLACFGWVVLKSLSCGTWK